MRAAISRPRAAESKAAAGQASLQESPSERVNSGEITQLGQPCASHALAIIPSLRLLSRSGCLVVRLAGYRALCWGI